jgi:hypothetical protein
MEVRVVSTPFLKSLDKRTSSMVGLLVGHGRRPVHSTTFCLKGYRQNLGKAKPLFSFI